MNIVILTLSPFPIGLAEANRIHSYGKGFFNNQTSVNVLILKPTEYPDKIMNRETQGICDNVPFIYTGGETIMGKSFFIRRFQNVKGLFRGIKWIINEHKKNKIDALIVYANSILVEVVFYFLTKILRISFLKEENEFPEIRFSYVKWFKKFRYYIFIKAYSLFDGLLLISNPLIQYIGKNLGKKTKILHVPMTVEFERFKVNNQQSESDPYIAYCGDLGYGKDGIPILIKAFSLFDKKIPKYKLYLIGDDHDKVEIQPLKKLIEELQLIDKVVFVGRVSRENIPNYLCNASLLVLARPNNERALYGFPSKLGEYLSTGKPTVVTKVGEIDNYLNDGINSFISEPDSAEAFAEKMFEALSDYERAKEIGQKGKEVVIKNFNYNVQGKKIIQFIKQLSTGNLN